MLQARIGFDLIKSIFFYLIYALANSISQSSLSLRYDFRHSVVLHTSE
jgi:hypothetical protein